MVLDREFAESCLKEVNGVDIENYIADNATKIKNIDAIEENLDKLIRFNIQNLMRDKTPPHIFLVLDEKLEKIYYKFGCFYSALLIYCEVDTKSITYEKYADMLIGDLIPSWVLKSAQEKGKNIIKQAADNIRKRRDKLFGGNEFYCKSKNLLKKERARRFNDNYDENGPIRIYDIPSTTLNFILSKHSNTDLDLGYYAFLYAEKESQNQIGQDKHSRLVDTYSKINKNAEFRAKEYYELVKYMKDYIARNSICNELDLYYIERTMAPDLYYDIIKKYKIMIKEYSNFRIEDLFPLTWLSLIGSSEIRSYLIQNVIDINYMNDEIKLKLLIDANVECLDLIEEFASYTAEIVLEVIEKSNLKTSDGDKLNNALKNIIHEYSPQNEEINLSKEEEKVFNYFIGALYKTFK